METLYPKTRLAIPRRPLQHAVQATPSVCRVECVYLEGSLAEGAVRTRHGEALRVLDTARQVCHTGRHWRSHV